MSHWGLSRVSTPMLEMLIAAVEQGRVPCPFNATDLADLGFRGPADDVVDLLGHGERLAVAVSLRVALAEREHRPPPRLDLVWTGPESKASTARSTALAIEHLFREATKTVILGGYRFDSTDLLEPLYQGMRDRGVHARCFLDIEGEATSAAGADAFATAQIDRFFRDVWVFGLPRPDVYYDPRTATPGPPWASLHAKCVVIDDKKSLVTSANFTDRGQTRNIEAGVLIEDAHFSEQLAGHWRQLVSEGLVRRYGG